MALYTASLRLTLPAVGEYSNTWGTVVNNGITSLTDSAIAGLAEIAMPDANYTLTVVNGSADEARRMVLRLSGALTAPRAVICPAAPKLYFVTNATNAVVTIRTDSGTGTAVGVGESAVVRCDGTNVVPAVTAVNGTLIPADDVLVTPAGIQTLTNKTFNLADNTLQGTLPIANGGTGATTASTARTALGATVIGANLFTLANPGAITFPRFNADNTVSSLADSSFRTAIGATTIGSNLFTLANPGAITFPRFNADNTVSPLNAADFRTAIGAGTGNGDVTLSGAQTLTNKRINPRVSTATSAATLTPDIASFDQYNLTAQAEALTIGAPTGTPVDGNRLVIRLLDNGTARALTWNATYTPIGVVLPVSTVVGKTTYVGCLYNASATRWDVAAVITQA